VGLHGSAEAAQAFVQEALSVSRVSAYRIVNGQQALTVKSAETLARALGVRAGWLLFGEGDPEPGVAEAREGGRVQGWGEAIRLLQQAAPTPVAETLEPEALERFVAEGSDPAGTKPRRQRKGGAS